MKNKIGNELDRYEFKYYSNDLENKGLISLGAGLDDYESTLAVIALEHYREASAILTDFGRFFISYLTTDDKG